MRLASIVCLVLTSLPAQPLRARSDEPKMPSTLAEGLLARFDEAASKMLQLAEAIPADKYSWRPAPKVRSVSEALVHVGMGNYYTLDFAGVKPQAKLKEDAETTVTDKAQVVGLLRHSNGEMRNALARLKSADLSRPATMFDQKTTLGNVYLFGVTTCTSIWANS